MNIIFYAHFIAVQPRKVSHHLKNNYIGNNITDNLNSIWDIILIEG